ncbi:hypothetical protein ABEG63_14350 [Chryseobacterium sp. C39-AII1]|uniref:hypothetical protein n=1 Tax=Chryseobacterium sp. C39-AII1 TaxID=3080332 RepID=UPI00320AAB90
MKKTLFLLSTLLTVGCSTSDLVSAHEEEVTKEILTKKAKNSSLSKSTNENVVMDLSFETGIISEGGGCSFEYLSSLNSPAQTSTQCYGPDPITQNGYLIRGYGKPRRASALRYDTWFGVKLEAKNDSKVTINRGREELSNIQESNAISIEFPFEANVTYEITLKTQLTDYVKVIKSPSSGMANSVLAERYKGIDASEKFSSINLQLVDSPIIPGSDPCSTKPVVSSEFPGPANYGRMQKTEKTTFWASEDKDYTFYFSTREAKNALLIKFLPGISEDRNPSYAPRSWFWLDIRNIKIVQKPFNPSYIVNGPCGFRHPC